MPAGTIEIISEDDSFLAINKPPGMETIAIGRHEGDQRYCLTSCCRAALRLETISPAHRLDRGTSGVQIFAKTAVALARLERAFRRRQVEKLYFALCLGVPANAEGVIRRNLSDWGGGRRPVQVVKGKGGFAAQSHYRLLAKGWLAANAAGGRQMPEVPPACEVSFLLWQPREGRTHQIRVHAAAFGYPILGDDQYGNRPANRLAKETCNLRRQALHCWRMSFPHPQTGAIVKVEAPMPADMRAALAACAISSWRFA